MKRDIVTAFICCYITTEYQYAKRGSRCLSAYIWRTWLHSLHSVGLAWLEITGVPNSRFEESIKYINGLCTGIERDVTALSARCYVTQRAVENLSALQGIAWNLKLRYTHLAWFLLSIWPISSFLRCFIQKSNILFHRAILSFVILNSIQCLVERSNS